MKSTIITDFFVGGPWLKLLTINAVCFTQIQTISNQSPSFMFVNKNRKYNFY